MGLCSRTAVRAFELISQHLNHFLSLLDYLYYSILLEICQYFFQKFFWWLGWESNHTFLACSAAVLPLNDPTIFLCGGKPHARGFKRFYFDEDYAPCLIVYCPRPSHCLNYSTLLAVCQEVFEKFFLGGVAGIEPAFIIGERSRGSDPLVSQTNFVMIDHSISLPYKVTLLRPSALSRSVRYLCPTEFV